MYYITIRHTCLIIVDVYQHQPLQIIILCVSTILTVNICCNNFNSSYAPKILSGDLNNFLLCGSKIPLILNTEYTKEVKILEIPSLLLKLMTDNIVFKLLFENYMFWG